MTEENPSRRFESIAVQLDGMAQIIEEQKNGGAAYVRYLREQANALRALAQAEPQPGEVKAAVKRLRNHLTGLVVPPKEEEDE